ncbi:unnamed protein product [Rotaria magnacalcarata]|uniref:Uncharacterized protein n=1 Tax=Rotaria magnacalcarata TaxID=392030 RepID=A0A8S3E2K3_9BILA|nr:unnamed protein product [Rotaria magnacalcarata]
MWSGCKGVRRSFALKPVELKHRSTAAEEAGMHSMDMYLVNSSGGNALNPNSSLPELSLSNFETPMTSSSSSYAYKIDT